MRFLSYIPLIGGRCKLALELFVFITPHIICADENLDEAEDDVRRD